LGDQLLAEIDNDVAEIAGLTARMEAFGEKHHLPPSAIFHMTLAFDEFLTNIIFYGFSDGERHTITVRIELDGDALEAEIIDDGIAFNPLARPAPDTTKSVEDRDVGGLGIHFIRTVMDKVEYFRVDGRNHLRMVKKVPAAPAS
jgi:anti-sigma regulatory factor (Ser/Thr protein kinase)